ncbi:uncharacterized protein Gasu_37980 [Galdieria sulphuraria]|uniref:PDZ domain-containing protein n=1 Tax=Galdieria sulphuraria TaxID=130081 RepID=M2XYW3_GALSU|nr:uncharacterized protein Gasu_37980 [Galdieria sulphuraria]EME28749.1 hypothetical protein Gasu_37980 [Galdieria sulphuraria]|eukprot:XP_005705269.1 hypothetical protein Gasu_37980 [Galdieria sulphuraria]
MDYSSGNRACDKIFQQQILFYEMETKNQASLLMSYYRWRRSIVNKGYEVDSDRHRQLAYFGLWKIGVIARYFRTLQNYAHKRKEQRQKAELFYKRLLAQKTLLALISHSLNSKVMVECDSLKDVSHRKPPRELHRKGNWNVTGNRGKSFPQYILTMGAWIEALEARAEKYFQRKLILRVFHLWLMYFHCAKISSRCKDKVTLIFSSRTVPSRLVQKTYYETSVETVLPVITFDQIAFRCQRTQITLLWKIWIQGIEDIRECKHLWASSWKQLRDMIHNNQEFREKSLQLPLKSSWIKPAVQRRQENVLQRWMDLRIFYKKQYIWNCMKLVLLDKHFNNRLAKRIYDIYLLRMGLKALYQFAFVKMPYTFILNEDETAVRYADEIDKRKRKSKYFLFWKTITKMHRERRQLAIENVQRHRKIFLYTKAKWALQHYVINIRYSERLIMTRAKNIRQSGVFRILQSYYKFRSNYSSSLLAKVSRSSLRVGGRYDIRRTLGKLVHVFHLPLYNAGITQKYSNYIQLWNKLLLESSTLRALKLHHIQRLHKGIIFSSLMYLLCDDLRRLSLLELRAFVNTKKRRRRLYNRALEFNQNCLLNRMFVTWRKNAQWMVAERQATQVAIEFSRHKSSSYWMPKWIKCVRYRKLVETQISNRRQTFVRKWSFMLLRIETLVGIYSQKSKQRPVRRVFRAFQQVLQEESKQRKLLLIQELKSNRIFETHLRRMMDGATFCVYRNSPCRKTDVHFHLDEHLEFLYSTRKELCFSLVSMLELEYGTDSSNYLEHLRKGGILAHESWQCFSIFLRNRSEAICLATDNERTLESWYMGLVHIMEILQRKTRTFSFKAMRGRMKLDKLCKQRNCSLARLLLEKHLKSTESKRVAPTLEHSLVSEAPLDMLSSQTHNGQQGLHYKIMAQALFSPELLIQELNEQLLKKDTIQLQGPVSFYLESDKIHTNKCNQYQAEEIQSWLQADARILRVTVQCDIAPVQEPCIVEEEQVTPLPLAPLEDLTPLPEDEPISFALSKTVSYIHSGRVPSLVPFARVRLVVPGSPSNASGLIEDDYILSLGRLRFYRDSRGVPFVLGCNISLQNISRWVEKECHQYQNGTLQLVVLRRLEYYPEESEEVIEEWRTFRLQVLPKASPRYHGLLGATFDFDILKQQFQEPSKNIPFAMVTLVQPGSPAAEAGFQPNDLILQYGSVCFTTQDHYENAQQLIQESLNAQTEEAIVVVVLRSNNEGLDNHYDAPLCMYRLLITPSLHYYRWEGIHGMQWSFFLAPSVIGTMDNESQSVVDT